MKKFTPFILVGMLLFLTGCQGKLSDKFDEEEVKNVAKDIVTQVNEGNVESVYNDIFSSVMKNAIALDTLQENLSYTLDKVGEFDSFEKIRGSRNKRQRYRDGIRHRYGFSKVRKRKGNVYYFL